MVAGSPYCTGVLQSRIETEFKVTINHEVYNCNTTWTNIPSSPISTHTHILSDDMSPHSRPANNLWFWLICNSGGTGWSWPCLVTTLTYDSCVICQALTVCGGARMSAGFWRHLASFSAFSQTNTRPSCKSSTETTPSDDHKWVFLCHFYHY